VTRTRRTNRALLALNAALLALLGAVTLAPSAGAGAPGRLRGEYAIIGGQTAAGGSSNAAYILDTTNQELLAIRWNATRGATGELEIIGNRDLTKDQQARPGR